MAQSPGQYLKAVREQLRIEIRQVQDASMLIAAEHRKEDFYISPARLMQIEIDGLIPNFFNLFSLCRIYGLNLNDLLVRYEMRSSV